MRTAMQNLHERWGLSTSKIARALDISQRVARLARDGTTTAQGAEKLDGFLNRVHDHGIEEPAAWMAEPVVNGFTVTRWHLYAAGLHELLVRNAIGTITDADLLHRHDPDWRRTYWTSSTTFVASDGHLSIREKTYDEVRAQVGGR
ncbi:hypothetical protein GCM10010172_80130 [Paractinoplanes ferrugineus]|uniref:Uncharacterized protein n=1 Tax=Paractinoplanes ferrugineus TaxID=113564 RepID=A0A919MJ52_9ACTN|nr:hypothetical protein [Actinoplanes ferrugineus]GIE16729.1 hypothetical protein Afe05nite_85690 [Actinoplanes ferrugineus]